MRLDQRKEHILDFIVRDYINTALPVSSARIAFKHDINASTATIRNIMQELDEDGFLCQPHTSAGRAPTDKGYMYFVDNLMELRTPDAYMQKEIDSVLSGFETHFESAFGGLSRMLAEHLKLFSGVGIMDKNEKIFGYGLSETLRAPEFLERDLAIEFAGFVENMADNIKNISGSENNLKPNITISGFGAVSVAFDNDEFGRCVVFSVGPKRMNYEKAASALGYAAKDITRKNKKIYGRKQ